jgi:hypothetical protein
VFFCHYVRTGPEDRSSGSKGDFTRALETRQLRRLTKHVATPTELSNEDIYEQARSNLNERFWHLQFGVSPASSHSIAVGGVVNASVRNAVQSTLRRFIRLSEHGVCTRCSMLKNLFARWRRASFDNFFYFFLHPPTTECPQHIRSEQCSLFET